jgi:hypothetical protein
LGLAAALALLAISCVSLPPLVGASSDLEGFDDGDGELLEQSFSDDFAAASEETAPLETKAKTERKTSDKKSGADKKKPSPSPSASSSYTPWKERDATYWLNTLDSFSKTVIRDHKRELLFCLLASFYALNYVLGSRSNESIVLEWANRFALPMESTKNGPPTIYGKNFALVGVDTKQQDSEIIFRDSQSTFKCYASGRRYVNWALTTLELVKRQDLISALVNLVMPKKDKLIVEVCMNEVDMQPMVLAVVKKKVSKAFIASHKDVRKFAKVIADPQAVVSSLYPKAQFVWPKRKLVVLSESRELFSDVITEAAIRNIFDSDVFLKYHDKYFESMHFTTEGKGLAAKNIMRFEFAFPRNMKKLGDLEALIELIFHEIDVVGAHKLSPESLKKAQSKRQEIEQEEFKSTLAQRQEIAQAKREHKFQVEKQGMTAAQAAKADEKRKSKMLKKQRPKMKLKA